MMTFSMKEEISKILNRIFILWRKKPFVQCIVTKHYLLYLAIMYWNRIKTSVFDKLQDQKDK